MVPNARLFSSLNSACNSHPSQLDRVREQHQPHALNHLVASHGLTSKHEHEFYWPHSKSCATCNMRMPCSLHGPPPSLPEQRPCQNNSRTVEFGGSFFCGCPCRPRVFLLFGAGVGILGLLIAVLPTTLTPFCTLEAESWESPDDQCIHNATVTACVCLWRIAHFGACSLICGVVGGVSDACIVSYVTGLC